MGKYNYVRDPPDSRDLLFHQIFNQRSKALLPPNFNLSSVAPLPPVLYQENLGSCSANSTSNGLRFLLKKGGKTEFQPSRLYIYWFARKLDGDVTQDNGSSLRNTMKGIAKNGASSEITWPYDIRKFTIKPSQIALVEGKKHRTGFQYISVRRKLKTIKNALLQGFPIIVGYAVYSSFESDIVTTTGTAPMPNVAIETFLGGHAVLMVSYDDSTKRFGLMNSWGNQWGNQGFFTLPYDYILSPDLTWDMWAIRFFA